MTVSPANWCGLALMVGAIGAWVQARDLTGFVRLHMRFAAALFAAPAIAMMAMPGFPQLALASMLMAVSLAAAALGLGSFARLSRPIPQTIAVIALVVALGCGLASTITGEAIYSLIPVMFAVACIAPFSFWPMLPLVLLGSFMLLDGGLALLDSGVNAAALFFAASLLALTRGLVRLKPAIT